MGRGASKAGGGGGTIGTMALPGVQTAGSISFDDMMAIRKSAINDASIAMTGATVSVIPRGGFGGGGVSRSNLPAYLQNNGMNRVVVMVNRNSNQSSLGLKTLLNAGFQIQADCINSNQTSGDYYYLIKQR